MADMIDIQEINEFVSCYKSIQEGGPSMNISFNSSQDRNTLFVGNLFKKGQEMGLQERIAQKRRLYVKQGNKMIQDADNAEKKIDQSLEDARGRMDEKSNLMGEYNQKIKDIDQQIDQLKEQFGVEDDSQEQKDLEILRKFQNSLSGISSEDLTEEEMERLGQMGETTDYQKAVLALSKTRNYYSMEAEKAQNAISAESKAIRQVKIDRLKQHGMVDAQKSKEELMDAASKEIMGMMVQDAKNTIEEKAQEVQEAAEKREEEKEEQEEKVEAVREDKEQIEAQVEANRENVKEMTEQVTKSQEITSDLQSEIEQLMEEEKMLMEDLKGMIVNKVV